MLDTTDEWIVSRTGMHERHIARDDEATSDMALAAAAHRRSQRAGCAPADIDCVIVATVTPDYLFPATASVLGRQARHRGHGGVRHRDRLQRLHLRADRRVEPDPLRRLPAHPAGRRREALRASPITRIARPRFCSATVPARSSSKRRNERFFPLGRAGRRRQRSGAALRSARRHGDAADGRRHRRQAATRSS